MKTLVKTTLLNNTFDAQSRYNGVEIIQPEFFKTIVFKSSGSLNPSFFRLREL